MYRANENSVTYFIITLSRLRRNTIQCLGPFPPSPKKRVQYQYSQLVSYHHVYTAASFDFGLDAPLQFTLNFYLQ